MMLGIPLSLNKIQRRDMYQLKEGANTVFHELGKSISGGHSYSLEEGKCTIGFSLVGKKNLILKSNIKEKTKYLYDWKNRNCFGYGRYKNKIISGKFYNEVIKEMTSSNIKIYKLLKKIKFKILQIFQVLV